MNKSSDADRPGPPRVRGKVDRTVIDGDGGEFEEEHTQAEPVRIEPGLKIEHYELIRELGRGGMGQVFLARDTRLGRRVAMKFLAKSSPRFAKRFGAEMKATARCQHENIVQIYYDGDFHGMPYMVLEYIEGTTLGQLLGKRIPANRAVEVMVPVVKALVAAHEANLVHRDLKPDNIVVTNTGTVKVLDFGVAKIFDSEEPNPQPRVRRRPESDNPFHTRSGAIVGTLPYMSPEQLGTDTVDHRSDLWAVGIILYEMLAAKHPLEPLTEGRLFGCAAAVDEPMPSIADEVLGLPDRLVEIVARCLAKKKVERYGTARELLADLEPLLPTRTGRSLAGDECPFPGLTAFQESDANRFFGRMADISETVARLRDRPLVGVVGPSGVGKSSFIRAGVVPALKSSGESWETIIIRPGRQPIAALAGALESLRDTRDSDPAIASDPEQQLRLEPGHFGARLRSRARRKRTQILLFVDQFEELFTLVADVDDRMTFTACLLSAGDDPASPLRVVVAMRSDFLDRAAENRAFLDELTRGLVFLQPPDRAGLEAALVHPVEMVGYKWEPGIVEAMLAALESTPGSLPLLQFTAAKLWALRDRQRHVLTREAYHGMGGVAGALATHADEVLAALSTSDQRVARAAFLRLVTPERTRAIVDRRELRDIAPDVDRVVDHAVQARLLVVQTRGDAEGAVELVHESLIKSWPTLQRWLDEIQDHAAFLSQVAVAAKQWDSKGRPQGLLWTGDATQEARLFRARYTGDLPPRERDFLDAVLRLADRSVRRKRVVVFGVIAVLSSMLAATGAIAFYIREQQQRAEAAEADEKHQKGMARRAEKLALDQKAEADKQREKALAQEHLAKKQEALAKKSYEELITAIGETNAARLLASRERKKAQLAADAAKRARVDAQNADLKAKKTIEDQKSKSIATELK